jgi:hypothetical protein
VFRLHSGIVRISVLCAVAAAAIATTKVVRHPFDTYRTANVPSFLFVVVCDTTGVQTQKLKDDLAAQSRAIALEETQYADLVRSQTRHREAATREAYINQAYGLQDSLFQDQYAQSKSMIEAADARYNYLLRQRAELESALNERQDAIFQMERWVPMTSLGQPMWNFLGGPPQYAQYYDCELRWFTYVLVPLVAALAGFLSVGIAGHVILLLSVASARVLRWVISGFRPGAKM